MHVENKRTAVGDPAGFQSLGLGPPQGRLLVVVMHGWMGTPTQLHDVVQAVRDAYAHEPALDLYVPPLPYATFFSFTPAEAIVSHLLAGMDALCSDPTRYTRIVLIGFSLGAIFTRRLFLAATDIAQAVPDAPPLATPGRRPWADKVERIISLGGLHRGWFSSGRLGWVEAFMSHAAGALGHLWPGAAKPTIFAVRRGAPFVVQTRLQWLALRRSSDPAKPEPLVIQLLGTQDNLIAPDDAVDFAVDRSVMAPYFYVELPHTRHDNAIVFSPTRHDRAGTFGAARKARFVQVLTSTKDALAAMAIPVAYLIDTLPEAPDETVQHVVFIVHGIRDDGYWTRKIAQKIHESAARAGLDPARWRCVTSSYGYFAMLPFLLPWIRRQKVEWLMDAYVGMRARFPNAQFSYVGHSNGTYLVARALQDYPAAQFHRVVFAGSVVRRDYDWAALLAAHRVHQILNLVATGDWVVALFPQGLEPLRQFFDLGGAGFGGFTQADRVPHVHEVRYVIGSHAAGLVETQWARIAEFIVQGVVPTLPHPDYTPQQSRWWRGVARVSPALLVLLVVAVTAVVVWLLAPIFTPGTTATQAAMHVVLALVYVLAVRFIVTRV